MTSFYPDKYKYSGTRSVSFLAILSLAILLISGSFFFSSCVENATTIGIELLPGSDFTSTLSTDSISVYSYTKSTDSVRSTNRVYSYLGGLYDPYFGTSSASFVAQLRLLKDFKGGTDYQIDSVKLYFTIAGAKGKLGTKQHIEFYEIGEMLDDDSVYYSNRDPQIIKYFGYSAIPIIKKDSAQMVVVKLRNSFAEYLMRDTAKLFQDDPKTDFRSYFKGVCVRMINNVEVKEISKDSLMLFALTFEQSDFVIRVYYQTPGATNQIYDFTINPNSVRYNIYSNDLTSADPVKMIKHLDDNIKDTVSFIQGFNGVYTKIRIPGLEYLKTLGNISVNRARLTFPVYFDSNLYTTSTAPTKIYISYLASDGIKYIVPDYVLSPTFFDGTFNSTSKKYTFNLATYLQMYIDGKITNNELELYFPEGEYKNVILKANSAYSKPRFEFTYTRF